MELQSSLEALKKAGIIPVAVSYDSVEDLSRFGKRSRISYTLLSDDGSKIIDAYKVRNLKAKGGRSDGIPLPGTIVVGKDGKIIAKLSHDGVRERHTGQQIIEAAK